MRRFRALVCGAVLALSLFAPHVGAAPVPPHAAPVCPGPVPQGVARCFAWVRTDVAAPSGGAGPAGYHPADLQAAYGLGAASATPLATPPTIAIVDAFDDPHAASDLATYRSTFGLPPCTAASGCFQKVERTKVSPSTSWSGEISLDLDMASAVCPNCKLLLVETSNSCAAMFSAVNWAVSQSQVVAVSNSWGCGEYSGELSDPNRVVAPSATVAITAAAGDGGYTSGAQSLPAAYPYVTAVGGTHLAPDTATTRRWSETVWSGAGSGCSLYVPQPSWQASVSPGCPTSSGASTRAVSDVAADADPNTGVAVYDTFGATGWQVYGGTSVATPIIAGVYALANAAGSVTANAPSALYSAPAGSLFDVTSGSNGSCSQTYPYLCTGEPGYDGPTGNGTPDGAGAF